jgi:hypothetical protein
MAVFDRGVSPAPKCGEVWAKHVDQSRVERWPFDRGENGGDRGVNGANSRDVAIQSPRLFNLLLDYSGKIS